MVQIVENWTDATVAVVAVRAAEASGHVPLEARLERAAEVAPFPNLLAERVGRTVEIRLPAALAGRLAPRPGLRLALRLRLADPQRAFAHPEIGRVVGP